MSTWINVDVKPIWRAKVFSISRGHIYEYLGVGNGHKSPTPFDMLRNPVLMEAHFEVIKRETLQIPDSAYLYQVSFSHRTMTIELIVLDKSFPLVDDEVMLERIPIILKKKNEIT